MEDAVEALGRRNAREDGISSSRRSPVTDSADRQLPPLPDLALWTWDALPITSNLESFESLIRHFCLLIRSRSSIIVTLQRDWTRHHDKDLGPWVLGPSYTEHRATQDGRNLEQGGASWGHVNQVDNLAPGAGQPHPNMERPMGGPWMSEPMSYSENRPPSQIQDMLGRDALWLHAESRRHSEHQFSGAGQAMRPTFLPASYYAEYNDTQVQRSVEELDPRLFFAESVESLIAVGGQNLSSRGDSRPPSVRTRSALDAGAEAFFMQSLAAGSFHDLGELNDPEYLRAIDMLPRQRAYEYGYTKTRETVKDVWHRLLRPLVLGEVCGCGREDCNFFELKGKEMERRRGSGRDSDGAVDGRCVEVERVQVHGDHHGYQPPLSRSPIYGAQGRPQRGDQSFRRRSMDASQRGSGRDLFRPRGPNSGPVEGQQQYRGRRGTYGTFDQHQSQQKNSYGPGPQNGRMPASPTSWNRSAMGREAERWVDQRAGGQRFPTRDSSRTYDQHRGQRPPAVRPGGALMGLRPVVSEMRAEPGRGQPRRSVDCGQHQFRRRGCGHGYPGPRPGAQGVTNVRLPLPGGRGLLGPAPVMPGLTQGALFMRPGVHWAHGFPRQPRLAASGPASYPSHHRPMVPSNDHAGMNEGIGVPEAGPNNGGSRESYAGGDGEIEGSSDNRDYQELRPPREYRGDP